MDDSTEVVGQRLREIRSWRQMTLKATADLAGLSYGYLGEIERGEKPVTKRGVLERLATALRVSPAELTGRPWTRSDPVTSDAHEALAPIEAALDQYDELGADPNVAARSWPAVAADVARLTQLRVEADYAAQGELLPQILPELHAVYVHRPEHRADALRALIQTYHSATVTTKYLGGRGLPIVAAQMAQRCAEQLDRPAWHGYAAWLRNGASSAVSRSRQYTRSVAAAERLGPALDDAEVRQAYGMLHLSAALAAASQGDRPTMNTHLDEADDVAARMGTEVGTFASLWFGTTNVGIWRTSLRTELGDGPAVADTARTVRAEQIPAPGRRAAFYADLGRALISERTTQDRGVASLLRAEKLAPQRVHNDVFVREGIADLLRTARRDAGGRELRGLAYRMGVAPAG